MSGRSIITILHVGRPLTFLLASCSEGPPLSVVFTDGLSMMPACALVREAHPASAPEHPCCEIVLRRGNQQMTGRYQAPPAARRQHGPDPVKGPSPGVGISGASGAHSASVKSSCRSSCGPPQCCNRVASVQAVVSSIVGIDLPTEYNRTRPPETAGTDTKIGTLGCVGVFGQDERAIRFEIMEVFSQRGEIEFSDGLVDMTASSTVVVRYLGFRQRSHRARL